MDGEPFSMGVPKGFEGPLEGPVWGWRVDAAGNPIICLLLDRTGDGGFAGL